MPFTSADLVKVDAAISTIAIGAKVVRFADGRSVEYTSMAELERARSLIINELAKQGGNQQVRQVRITTRDGWGY